MLQKEFPLFYDSSWFRIIFTFAFKEILFFPDNQEL